MSEIRFPNGRGRRARSCRSSALVAAGGRPPLGRLALIKTEHDWSFTPAGLPDGPQRVLWRVLACLARDR